MMNAKMSGRLISLIVPTRGRPSQMLSFLQSVYDTAASPEDIEVVLVVDDDDDTSNLIVFDGIKITRVVVSPGLTMGELNTAGYKESNGEYIMLCNDDIAVKTPGWDRECIKVFDSFPDRIVLVHVNDAMFESKLCIFPFVSRRFCDVASGICESEYIRYCIDDHIYNIFVLISILGYNRIVYLPGVLFEHLNFEIDGDGKARYVANPDIHRRDVEIFKRKLQARKDLAVRFACLIDENRRSDSERAYIRALAFRSDFDAIPNVVQTRALGQIPSTFVTIFSLINHGQAQSCVCSTDIRRTKYQTVYKYSNNQIINLAKEFNDAISVCNSDYIILSYGFSNISDRFIDNLLLGVTPDVAVAAPIVFDKDRSISYSGGTLSPENNGIHGPSMRMPDIVTPVQTAFAPIILVDLNKVGHLRFDENFSDSFLYLDYCLQVWEAGFSVVVAPDSSCIKNKFDSFTKDMKKNIAVFSREKIVWQKKWASKSRIDDIIKNIWSKIPEFKNIIYFESVLDDLISGGSEIANFEYIISLMGAEPVIHDYTRRRVQTALREALEGDMRDHIMNISIRLQVDKFDSRQLKGVDSLWFMPLWFEREFGKLLCTFGIKQRGEIYWNNSLIRERIEAADMSLFGDSTSGFEDRGIT